MTSGRLLARNTVLNLIGQGAPMAVALVAIPLLIQGLGTDRFGVLTLAWMAIGYFSLFDLGLSRALTQLLAERLGADSQEEMPALTWTALLLMVFLGVAGGGLLALLSPVLVGRVLNIPAELQGEALRAFYLLSASLPCVISTAGLRGVLEAHQRFGAVNAIRLPMGVLTFLGPLLVLPFSRSLVPVVAVLAAGRVLAWIAHLAICLRTLPYLRGGVVVRREVMGPLVRFGGWMTVSNIVSPLMVYVDRFLIGALLSMAAVAYYVTPYEVVTKLWLIPGALMGVLFPAFAATAAGDRGSTARLFGRGVRMIFLAMFPPILLLVALAPEGLGLWLGSDFALHSAPILRWLAVGVFINSLGQAPFTVLQGIGRPDITGKLHLLELPLYGAAIYWLVQARGVEGAAIAWVLRVSLDTLVLFVVAGRMLPDGGRMLRRISGLIAPALLVLGAALLPQQPGGKAAFLLVVLPGFALLAWRHVLDAGERTAVRAALTPGSLVPRSPPPLPHDRG